MALSCSALFSFFFFFLLHSYFFCVPPSNIFIASLRLLNMFICFPKIWNIFSVSSQRKLTFFISKKLQIAIIFENVCKFTQWQYLEFIGNSSEFISFAITFISSYYYRQLRPMFPTMFCLLCEKKKNNKTLHQQLFEIWELCIVLLCILRRVLLCLLHSSNLFTFRFQFRICVRRFQFLIRILLNKFNSV